MNKHSMHETSLENATPVPFPAEWAWSGWMFPGLSRGVQMTFARNSSLPGSWAGATGMACGGHPVPASPPRADSPALTLASQPDHHFGSTLSGIKLWQAEVSGARYGFLD